MLNFTNANGYAGTMPAGTMLEGTLTVEELRKSSAGNDYLNVRFDVTAPFQFEGRKVWTNVMLTQDAGQAPAGVGYSQVKAVLECGGADPVASPDAFTFPDFAAVARALNGAQAAVRVGVEDTQDGGQRNTVKLFLSPNPSSGTRRMWQQLQSEIGRSATPWPPQPQPAQQPAQLAAQEPAATQQQPAQNAPQRF